MLYFCTWTFNGTPRTRVIHDKVLWKMFDLEDRGIIQDFIATSL